MSKEKVKTEVSQSTIDEQFAKAMDSFSGLKDSDYKKYSDKTSKYYYRSMLINSHTLINTWNWKHGGGLIHLFPLKSLTGVPDDLMPIYNELRAYQKYIIAILNDYREFKETPEYKTYKEFIEKQAGKFSNRDMQNILEREVTYQSAFDASDMIATCKELLKDENYKEAMICALKVARLIMLMQIQDSMPTCAEVIKKEAQGKQPSLNYGREIAGYIEQMGGKPNECSRSMTGVAYEMFRKNNLKLQNPPAQTLRRYLLLYLDELEKCTSRNMHSVHI